MSDKIKNRKILRIVLGVTVVTAFAGVIGLLVGWYFLIKENTEKDKETSISTFEYETNMNTIVLDQEPDVVIQNKDDPPMELLPKEFRRQVLKDTTGYQLHDFTILEKIGSGSSAVIYKAFNKRANQNVVFKVYEFGLDGDRDIKRQFYKERRSLQLLKDVPFIRKMIWHTRINKQEAKKLFGDGKLQGILVLEYFPNGDLYEAAIVPGTWDFTLLRKWLAQMVVALQNMHARGLLHRDIKPHNILLSQSQDVYLCDLGIAKRVKLHSRSNFLPGTPIFLAPEVVDLHGFTRATDIFALGVTLYVFIAKDLSYFVDKLSEKVAALWEEIQLEKFGKLQKQISSLPVNEKIPAELHDLYKRMTDPDPEKRITIPQIMEHPFFKDVDWKQLGALVK